MEKKRLRVYVAGAYSDTDVLRVLRNIGRGQEWASTLFILGFAPFSPWFDKEFVIHNWTVEFNVGEFYEYSMEWLSISDAVFVVPNYPGMKKHQESKGVSEELRIAKELNIPIFYDTEKLCEYGESRGFKV